MRLLPAPGRLKTLGKEALCALYQHTGAQRLHEARLRRAGRTPLAVLVFHRVTDAVPADGLTVGTARFRQLCGLLRRGYRVVPLGEVFRLARSGGPVPPRTVAITFDDCYRDNLPAAEVLAEHGLPACFFIPAAFVGTGHVFPWDRDLPRMPNLSWDEVRAMQRMGHEIGSHTVNHVDLGAVPYEEARREIVNSKKLIEEQVGRPVRWFAYPYGAAHNFRPETVALVEEAGYEGSVSAHDGLIPAGCREPVLPRVPVPSFPGDRNLELHITGCLSWLYAWKRRAGLIRIPAAGGERTGDVAPVR